VFAGQFGDGRRHVGGGFEHVFDGETFSSSLEGVSADCDNDAVGERGRGGVAALGALGGDSGDRLAGQRDQHDE